VSTIVLLGYLLYRVLSKGLDECAVLYAARWLYRSTSVRDLRDLSSIHSGSSATVKHLSQVGVTEMNRKKVSHSIGYSHLKNGFIRGESFMQFSK
jgi:hypothetical protein